jgi:hypothetical protein
MTARAAPEKRACFDAYEEVQRLRKQGKLRDAQARMVVCTAAECPAFIASDCANWSRELEAILPTVIFVAKDAAVRAPDAPRDIQDARVLVDDVEVTGRTDGRPVPIDPGQHSVVFEWNGLRVKQVLVIAQGEHDRRVEASFGVGLPPTKAVVTSSSAIPTGSFVFGAISLVGFASFAGFGLIGKGQERCAPQCTQDEVSALRRSNLVADLSLITAVAALGTAVVLWLIQPSRQSPLAMPVE